MKNTEQNSQPALASEERLGEVPSNARAVGSIHPNSLAAYAETAKQRASLRWRIMGLMADGRPRTDRQISSDLSHLEKLNPRITDLVQEGLLHEVGSQRCEVTGIEVRVTRRFL